MNEIYQQKIGMAQWCSKPFNVYPTERDAYQIIFSAYIKCLKNWDWDAAAMLRAHLVCVARDERKIGECDLCLRRRCERITKQYEHMDELIGAGR